MFEICAIFKYSHSLHKEILIPYLFIFQGNFEKLFDTIKVFYCTDINHTSNCLFVSLPKAKRNEPYQVSARSVQSISSLFLYRHIPKQFNRILFIFRKYFN